MRAMPMQRFLKLNHRNCPSSDISHCILLAGLASVLLWSAPVIAAGPINTLNDTGITFYGDAKSNALTTEPADYPGQDARYGRDAQEAAGLLAKTGGGSKGFDFTKIANDGTEAPETAALGTGAKDWGCTRDNVTGLMWEIKTTSGLRSQDNTYTWYDSNSATNGGDAGISAGGSCSASDRCDTEKFVEDVNAAVLCGHSDWRMPSAGELMSIVDYGITYPTLDRNWFPNTSAGGQYGLYYWWASAMAYNSSWAWYVDFKDHQVAYDAKSSSYQVRLVRAGQ